MSLSFHAMQAKRVAEMWCQGGTTDSVDELERKEEVQTHSLCLWERRDVLERSRSLSSRKLCQRLGLERGFLSVEKRPHGPVLSRSTQHTLGNGNCENARCWWSGDSLEWRKADDGGRLVTGTGVDFGALCQGWSRVVRFVAGRPLICVLGMTW